jgi:lycopene beta-cyclase
MSLPESSFDADLLILGGGCAGLSLATRMATTCPSIKVIVVEPRTCYVEDRTWCGWRTEPHSYQDCVVASWPHWRVKYGVETILRGSDTYPYEMISASRFYTYSLSKIQSSRSLTLSMGASADRVMEDHERVTAALSNGQTLRARWAVDTRPRRQVLTFPSLWQNFVGYEIHGDQRWTDRLGTTPLLMDFQASGSAVLQFMYVVPLGDHRFLCEWTRFSSLHGEADDIESALHAWLTIQGCQASMLGRRESGSLPMSVVPPPNAESSRVVPAGTVGGSMRASTGYAFHAIQRWADRCVASLAAGGPPVAPIRSPMLDFLDQVFLTAMQDRSVAAETVFMKLFERTRPEVLVRFLSGIPQSQDILPVMASLPWIHFSKAALNTILRDGTA